jgi:hypothetical protein
MFVTTILLVESLIGLTVKDAIDCMDLTNDLEYFDNRTHVCLLRERFVLNERTHACKHARTRTHAQAYTRHTHPHPHAHDMRVRERVCAGKLAQHERASDGRLRTMASVSLAGRRCLPGEFTASERLVVVGVKFARVSVWS